MEAWELGPKPCPCRTYDHQVCDKEKDEDLANVCIDVARWYYRREGYAKALEHLAAQCGPNPCEGCTHKWLCDNEKRKHICDQHISWLGQQQGYAKGLAEGKDAGYRDGLKDGIAVNEQCERAIAERHLRLGRTEREQEIVQFVSDLDSLSYPMFVQKYGKSVADEGWENSWPEALKLWLKGKDKC